MIKAGDKLTVVKRTSYYNTKNTLYPGQIYTCAGITADSTCRSGVRVIIKHNGKIRSLDSSWFISAEKLDFNNKYTDVLKDLIND